MKAATSPAESVVPVGACRDRMAAFEANGVTDPLLKGE